eukprot:1158667-Pelagomonas_calceolata.AAC.1
MSLEMCVLAPPALQVGGLSLAGWADHPWQGQRCVCIGQGSLVRLHATEAKGLPLRWLTGACMSGSGSGH